MTDVSIWQRFARKEPLPKMGARTLRSPTLRSPTPRSPTPRSPAGGTPALHFHSSRRGRRMSSLLAMCLLIGAATAVFMPTLDAGFMWDDPVWFGRVVSKSWWQTLQPIPAFQFYRPATMLYIWLFQRPGGVFAIEMLHGAQIGWHSLNIALTFVVARRLGLSRWGSVAAAALFAFNPLSYQAVAWAAPQQPMASAFQTSAWLLYFMARPPLHNHAQSPRPVFYRRAMLSGSLIAFVTALMIQESSASVAFVPLLYECWRRKRTRAAVRRASPGKDWWPALLYVAAAAVYGLLWLQVPRRTGITTLSLAPKVGYYLLQGIVYPVWGRPSGYNGSDEIQSFIFLGVTTVVIGGLLGLAAWRKRGWSALVALIWAGLSLTPAFIGLNYSYVSLASRLFYISAMGVALLWTTALWPAGDRAAPAWRRIAGPVLLLLIVGQSARLLADQARLYRDGTDHLRQAVAVMTQQDGRYLFINFPDRYQEKRPPYPFGYWGITLAPVVVDLADFPPIIAGAEAQSSSRSLPWLDAEAREAGPYDVDMRGIVVQSGQLAQLAADGTAVYVSRHLADGRFRLQKAGRAGVGCGSIWLFGPI